MNSKQRRKAYRAMPKAGTTITITSRNGKQRKAVVLGRSMQYPMLHPNGGERRCKFDTARIQVRYEGGGMALPLLSTITY